MIDGNDGGIAFSNDRGKTWRFVDNLPLGQYYHINVDMEIPYNVYGGMQDNGSWRGPSEVWENGGIRNWHWKEVCFGDGFATLVDASDANYGYAMSQGGGLIRFNSKTGERKDIRPEQGEQRRLEPCVQGGLRAVSPPQFLPQNKLFAFIELHTAGNQKSDEEVQQEISDEQCNDLITIQPCPLITI